MFLGHLLQSVLLYRFLCCVFLNQRKQSHFVPWARSSMQGSFWVRSRSEHEEVVAMAAVPALDQACSDGGSHSGFRLEHVTAALTLNGSMQWQLQPSLCVPCQSWSCHQCAPLAQLWLWLQHRTVAGASDQRGKLMAMVTTKPSRRQLGLFQLSLPLSFLLLIALLYVAHCPPQPCQQSTGSDKRGSMGQLWPAGSTFDTSALN